MKLKRIHYILAIVFNALIIDKKEAMNKIKIVHASFKSYVDYLETTSSPL